MCLHYGSNPGTLELAGEKFPIAEVSRSDYHTTPPPSTGTYADFESSGVKHPGLAYILEEKHMRSQKVHRGRGARWAPVK